MRAIRSDARPAAGPSANHPADRTPSAAGEKVPPPAKPADSSWRSNSTITPSSRRATISGPLKETSLLRKILTEPKTTPAGEPVESLLDIRGRIHCKLFNYGDGVCPYQDKCHYRHALRDGTLVKADYIEQFTNVAADGLGGAPSLAEMRSQIPCKLFNYGQGVCEYGASCYYRHCTKDGLVLEKTGSMSSLNRLRFQNPYGEGDICAAGIVPYNYTFVPEKFKDEGAIWALLQVEDIRVEGTKKWRAGLALFGGKVQEEDADWLETTAREFAEETGGLLGKFKPLQNLITGVPLKISCFRIEAATDAGSFTKYLGCKYQVLYYPIEDEDMNDFLQLPERYWELFQGQVSRDWTRAAVRMEPVVLRRVEVMREVLAAQEAAKPKEPANDEEKNSAESATEGKELPESANDEAAKSGDAANEEAEKAAEANSSEENEQGAEPGARNRDRTSESSANGDDKDGDAYPGRATERRQRRSSGSDGDMAQSWRSNSRVRNDSESSDSSDRFALPPRGWVVCDINTGNIHELGCSVQLRQALEMADFPRPEKKPPKRVFKDVLAEHLEGSTPPRLPAAPTPPKSLNGSALTTAAPRTPPRATPPAASTTTPTPAISTPTATNNSSSNEWARGTATPRMAGPSPRIAPQVSSRTSITGAPVSPVPVRVASPVIAPASLISPTVAPPPMPAVKSAVPPPPPVAVVSSVGTLHEKTFREEMEELFEAHKNHIIVLLVALLLFVTMRQ